MTDAMLLKDIKNYLDINYDDQDTDDKVRGIMRRGIAYLDDVAGVKQDYEEEGRARALLFDYCRYARSNALELYQVNFAPELLNLRMGVQADGYAEQSGVSDI